MLLLDSEALSALAHGKPKQRFESVRALVSQARAGEHVVSTSAAVLAEVIRGRRADAAVFGSIRRDEVDLYPVDTQTAVRAGQLMGAARMGSEHAVDAFVVALGDLHGGAVVATVDTGDVGRLAQHATNVRVADIR